MDFATLAEWTAAHPGWLVAAGFVLAFLEALAVAGIVVPGIFLLFVLGALVGLDLALLAPVAAAVLAGAVAGDGLSFWLGRLGRDRLHRIWPFTARPQWLAHGEAFFRAHGGKSVILGRFIGPLRPVIPLVAGSLDMPPAQFVPRMLFACLLWTPAMLLPGVVFGESLALAADFGARLTLLLVLLVVGGWLLIWASRRCYEAAARRAPWWLKNVALWLRRHPRLGRWLGPLFEPGGREVTTVVILGLMLSVSLAVLFAALLLAPLSAPAWEAGFERFGLAASLRNHYADPLFFGLVLSTSTPVLAALVALMALMLLVRARWNALLHWLLATIGGGVLALLLNALMGLLLGRPAGSGAVGEVPNVHFTVTVLVFGFGALMLAKDFRPRQRKWLYLGTIVLLALAAFGEYYLGRATAIGLVAGLALSLGWLAVTGIGYRTRADAFARPGRELALLMVAWAAAASIQVAGAWDGFAAEYRLEQPRRELAGTQWWQSAWRELPMARSRIGSAANRRFDAQLAVPLEALAGALSAAGWSRPPTVGIRSIGPLLRPDSPLERRPVLPRDFAGQPESLLLRRIVGADRMFVVRAWDSGVRVGAQAVPVWLVQAQAVEPARRFGLFNGWSVVAAAESDALASIRRAGDGWAWRIGEDPALPLAAEPLIGIGADAD